MEAVEVERPHDHLFTASRLFGESLSALQLAWADARGYKPWEPEHRARKAGQPLLGKRALVFCHERRRDLLDVSAHLE